MKKSAVDRKLARLPGFKKKDGFYFGTCNDDVMAGYCIDAPPSCIYICRFVIPTYDDIDFMHMSLGGRILNLPRNDSNNESIDIAGFLRQDWSEFSKLSDRKHLIAYLDREGFQGVYALWTRYITHIRNRDFKSAEQLENAEGVREKFLGMPAVAKNLASLSQAKAKDGWEGCYIQLGAWLNKTKETYC
ncbi:MAG: hypothetical protein QM661_07875 [Solimonas sp.]